MAKLLYLLSSIWDWFAWAFREVTRWLVAAFQTVWGKVLVVVAWIWTVVTFSLWLLAKGVALIATDFMASFTDTAVPTALLTTLSVINYVLPLHELITYMVAYGGVLAIMALYRHVKSYVPGAVSGGT